MTPGWVTTHRFSRSISRIRSIAVKAIVSAPSRPVAPPLRPEPAPRGTIGTSNSAQMRTSSATSAVVVGQGDGAGQTGREVRRLVAAVRLAIGDIGEHAEAGKRPLTAVEERRGDDAAGHGRECTGGDRDGGRRRDRA